MASIANCYITRGAESITEMLSVFPMKILQVTRKPREGWPGVLNKYIWLVGGIPTPLKKMTSSVGMMTFPTEWKHKTCSKPPTSNYGISTSASWDISFTPMMKYNPQKLVDLHPQVNKTGQNTAKSHG